MTFAGRFRLDSDKRTPLKRPVFLVNRNLQVYLITTLLHSANVLFRTMSPALPFWGATLDLTVRRLAFGFLAPHTFWVGMAVGDFSLQFRDRWSRLVG